MFAQVSTYPTRAQHKCQHDIHTRRKVTDGREALPSSCHSREGRCTRPCDGHPRPELRTLLILCCCLVAKSSKKTSFATLWIVAHQAPLSIGFSRQEYWSGLHFFLQGSFPAQGSSLSLLHCGWILYRWPTREAPVNPIVLNGSLILKILYL